jgi:hypothetical protein
VSPAAITFEGGEAYSIIIRQTTGLNTGYRYQTLCKAALEEYGNPLAFYNEVIYQSVAGGTPIGSIVAANWSVPSLDVVMLTEVILEKEKVSLSSDIIDELNTDIELGYSSLMGGSDTTIVATSDDFITEYVRDVDYEIVLIGSMFYIKPLTLTINDFLIARWVTSPTELISIVDHTKHGEIPMLTESSEHGDENMFETFRIQGERLRPSDLPITTNKKFPMYPGVGINAEQEIKQAKNVEVINTLDWDDTKLAFKEAGVPVDTSAFAVEFTEPIILGTTAYQTHEGRWRTGDKVVAGSVDSLTRSVPMFYEVDVTSASFDSKNYNIMLKQQSYRAWRVATENDYADMMLDDVVIGTPPTGEDDVRTDTHFYLKNMNSRNRSELYQCDWVAYETEYALYFKNENGTIVRDETFTSRDQRNPIKTSYLDLAANIVVSAEDLFGYPLFPYHGEIGFDGYSADAHASIKRWMSAKVVRVDISNLGLSVIYDNYDDENNKKFLHASVSAYPINNVLNIISEVNSGNQNHADAKEYSIQNELLQNQPVIDLRVRGLAAFWKYDRLNYKASAVYHPRFRPGTIVRVTSERENLDNALFAVFSPKHTLTREGFLTDFGSLLQL